MPSRIASMFFRLQPAQSQDSSAGEPRESKVKKRTSLFLRKRPEASPLPPVPAAAPAPAPAARDNVVLDCTQRSPRPHRASTTNVPDRPSILPIYESFTSGRRRSLMTHDERRDGGPSSSREHKLPRVATVANFQDLERHRKQKTRRSAGSPKTKMNKRLKYDRALELAKAYQAIIPDPRTMWDEDDNDNGPRQKEGNTCSSNFQHGARQGTPKRRTKSLAALHKSSLNPTSRLSRTSVVSSTTAAESVEPAQAPTIHQRHSTSGSTPEIKAQRPPSSTTASKPTQPEPAPDATTAPKTTNAPDTTTAPKLDRRHDRCSRTSQHTSVGMQICTELLTDQLMAALQVSHQRRDNIAGNDNDNRDDPDPDDQQQRSTRRMQVLLMIEAYENVLRRMQSEAAVNGNGGGTEAEGSAAGERRRQVGEAVPVLEHWLDSLHALYDGTFAEDGVDGA